MRLLALLLLSLIPSAEPSSWWGDDDGPIQGIPASFVADKSMRHWGTIAKFQSRRSNLVVAVVAKDSWTPAALGYNDSQANWDLLAIYAGSTPGWTCGPACIHTVHMPGLKWGLISQLAASNFWQDLRTRYRYIMFPDDDLSLGACGVSAVFDAMAAFNLLLSQPSICEGGGSYARHGATYQRAHSVLHFTNYVGLLSPAFDMSFFDQQVVPLLDSAQTGLGLDWCWVHRLGYPRDRVAVVDTVCASHAVDPQRLEDDKKRSGRKQPIDCSRAADSTRCEGGLYSTALERTGRQPAEEQAAAWAACGYSQASAEMAGQQFQRPHTYGSLAGDSGRPAAVGLRARLAACKQGLPRGLAYARASYLAVQKQQAAAAAGSWGYAPLLAASVVLAPLSLGSGMWLWRRCQRALQQHRLRGQPIL